MNISITALALLGTFATHLLAQPTTQLSTNQIQIIKDGIFKVVQDCSLASETFREIKIGSPLSDVSALKDTPLPKGYYWPEYIQKDGSLSTINGAMRPPAEWGTNCISRIDAQTIKQFYFYHDGTNVVKIVYHTLFPISTAPSHYPLNDVAAPPLDPTGPLDDGK